MKLNLNLVGEIVNKEMLSFLKGLSVVVVLLLLSVPLILMNIFEGDLSGPWIGFWGSFAGGILGTAGVIYVAYLQNAAQKSSMKTIEKNNLKRLRVQTLLKLLDDYNKEVSDLLNVVTTISSDIHGLVKNMNELSIMNLNKYDEEYYMGNDDRFRENIEKYKNNILKMELTPKYITNRLGQLEYKNLILIEQGLGLSKKLNGQEAVYMDKLIEEICSNNFSEFKLKEIIIDASKCEENNYSKIFDWLLQEQSLIHNASSHLLDELSPK